MRKKVYYYADKPKDDDIEATLKYFADKYSWNGLIRLDSNLRTHLEEAIKKLMWYKEYQNDINNKSIKNLEQKEINQKYIEFVERLKNDVRIINKYLDKKPVNLDLPNTSPSILKELEDRLIIFKFTKTNIDKILNPLKEFSGVEKLGANKEYELKKGRDTLLYILSANQNTKKST